MMKKLVALHGGDHKTGTTMLAQSLAELIALRKKDMKVLLITLNSRKNAGFVREKVQTIDDYRVQLDSRLLIREEFIQSTRRRNNLHMLAGLVREEEERYYHPETAEYLLKSIEDDFDLIISDTGCSLDNGLAYGGLRMAAQRFLVLNQMESTIRRVEERRSRYQEAGIQFNQIILNQFQEKDPYSVEYLSERLDFPKDRFLLVHQANYSRQAEMEYRTLMEYRDELYREDIRKLANVLLGFMGEEGLSPERKGLWKNFI
jgi:cellulose biosynthesis protein BcsQ